MSPVPQFFVPAATPETEEAVYTEFAKICGVPAPPRGQRVFSITFNHNGEIWNATVGESMRGKRTITRTVKGKKLEHVQAVNDPAVVLAIFPGNPYVVMTNHRLVGNVRSRWENPFLAGVPFSVTEFA